MTGMILTVLIAGAIAAALAAIVVHGIRARRRGGCSCGCAGCPSAGLCHAQRAAAKGAPGGKSA